MHQIIHLHPASPPKPPEHQSCNGCGVCCTVEPCPLGAIASLRLQGPCAVLVWVDTERLYRCGLVSQPSKHMHRLLRWAAPAVAKMARRYIAADAGCDCGFSTQTIPAHTSHSAQVR